MVSAAIIVAGGAARRLGGVAKPWLEVAGRPMIEHVIAAAYRHCQTVIVVGQPPMQWVPPAGLLVTVEHPQGGGPAAAVRAGMRLLPADVRDVVLLAGDAPFVAPSLDALMTTRTRSDGLAVVTDGSVQYLCARLRRTALAHALDVGGASMHSVFDHLQIDTIEAEVRDADTWEDVATLRKAGGSVSDNAWLDEATTILDIDPVIDIDAVLALARDVAHNQERKNAPLTAFLLGFAAAQKGYSPAQVAELAAKLGARAIESGSNG